MATTADKKSLLVMAFVFTLVVGGTVIVSLIARGYQINLKNGPVLSPTGIISVTSTPKSASVFINDRLITATDDTINLPPGSYQIRIIKDGYLPWQKQIQVKNEVVYQTDADLFRSVTDLKPITYSGIVNPTVNNDGTKVIYAVASASATANNGLYLYETANNPLPLLKNQPRQLAPNYATVNWAEATFTFSPDSKQILANFKTTNITYLLNLDSAISQNQLYDVTARLPLIQAEWQTLLAQIIQSRLERVPKEIKGLIATDSAQNIIWSPTTQQDRFLYLASGSGVIKTNIISPPPAQSTQTQSRTLAKDNYYVYDLKDDTNFLIGKKSDLNNIFWLPNSSNLVFVQNDTIKVIEDDSTNLQTLFGGSFNHQVVLPSIDGSQVITVTSAYSQAPQNLYSITIK